MLPQPGLKWEFNRCFEAEPIWTHDPSLETIIKLARQHLQLGDNDNCTADYYMQGAFNKVYLIRCPRGGPDERSFVFRASLPVDPGFKVSSDVATMMFVRDHTDAPVPRVLAFDASHENGLGFAWTIMEMMPGRPLCEQWRHMTRKQKEDLVKRVASVCAQMFRHKFSGIGNIYQTSDASPRQNIDQKNMQTPHSATSALTDKLPAVARLNQSQPISDIDEDLFVGKYTLGRIASMAFIWHTRVHFDVYRGPFASSYEWLAARLAFMVTESDAVLRDQAADQKHEALASKYSSLAKRLQKQQPKFFPANSSSCLAELTSEITTLHHYDTSGYNVLVDEEGRLTALLDWDSVSAVPLWKACQMPEFLMSKFIDEFEEHKKPLMKGDCDNSQTLREEAISLEKTELRTLFLAEMERIEPAWVRVHKNSGRFADFEMAVQLCDSHARSDFVDGWLQDIEQGKVYWSLQERLLTGR